MLQGLDVISHETRQNAIRIIAAQSSVPISPLTVTSEGELQLCAAAALAIANVGASDERERLIDEMAQGGRDSVLKIFERMGWTRQLGLVVLIANDAMDDADRKIGVLNFLG